VKKLCKDFASKKEHAKDRGNIKINGDIHHKMEEICSKHFALEILFLRTMTAQILALDPDSKNPLRKRLLKILLIRFLFSWNLS